MAPKVLTAEKAASLIKDGASICVCGLLGMLTPSKILRALESRFLETGHPADLTEMHPMIHGIGTQHTGLECFAHEGMLKRVIGSSYSLPYYEQSPMIDRMILENKVEAYSFPGGVIYGLLREIAAKRPGLINSASLHTYVDPRYRGGKLNNKTKEDLVELIDIRGEEYLFFKAFPIDVALIRGTSADEEGNISLEREGSTFGILHQAMAARNSGGLTICQVQRLIKTGTIHPRMVEVPGIFVDVIVIDENQALGEYGTVDYNPALVGEIKAPIPPCPVIPMNTEKVISRRAVLELRTGDICNCGGGMALLTATQVIREEGINDHIRLFIEHGSLGGINIGGYTVPTQFNCTSIMNSLDTFDFFTGGGVDITFLGFGQVDGKGNVNVSRFASAIPGVGGFQELAGFTNKIVFIGHMTAKGLKVDISTNGIHISEEGRQKKFLKEVEEISFNAQMALKRKQKVLYVTERCVFRLTEKGLELIEIAPGVNLEKDIRSQMQCEFTISESIKEIDKRIYDEKPMKYINVCPGEPLYYPL